MRSSTRFPAACTLLLAACLGGSPSEPGIQLPPEGEIPENALRVLFVGNSLTYFNDLPAMVSAMATATRRERPPAFAQSAAPDFSLEDHWRFGQARQAIEARRWDFVVLQQGPSSLPQNREHLRAWSETFAGPIRASGARPALYMVWPASSRFDDFPGVYASYSGAATAVDGVFMPAGQAWLTAWQIDPGLGLYGPDGFHPSPAGSYLAALVIYARLYDASPDDVPATLRFPNGPVFSLPTDLVDKLKRAARETLAAH